MEGKKEEQTKPPAATPLTAEQYTYQRNQYVNWADTQLERLHDRHTLSGQEFDKQIVALAGGGLALTLTLAKDVFEAGNVQLAWVVYASWACFLAALTANLLSHRTAADHYNLMTERMGCLRRAAVKGTPVDGVHLSELSSKIDKLTPQLKRMNNTALAGTLIGIFLFIVFIAYNHHDQQPRTSPHCQCTQALLPRTSIGTGTKLLCNANGRYDTARVTAFA